MYKKVKQYAVQNGLIVDEKSGLAYGQINGFFVAIRQDPVTPARHTVNLWIKPGQTDPFPTVTEFLNQCTTKLKYLQTAVYHNFKITAEFQGLGFKWGKEYVPCLDSFFKEITGYCANNGMITCCEHCGAEYDLNLYQIDGVSHGLCPSCYGDFSNQNQQNINQKIKEGNGNIIGGIVGALLGSLIGVILWVLIYQLGYISAIAGAVMIVCALKGYEMLGGKLNKTGIIISCIISVIMVFFAEQLSLALEIYKSYNDALTFFGAFQSIPAFMTISEVRTAVFGDLAIGYILLAVGAWSTVYQALKKGTGKTDARMIAPFGGTNSNHTL